MARIAGAKVGEFAEAWGHGVIVYRHCQRTGQQIINPYSAPGVSFAAFEAAVRYCEAMK